MIKGEKKAVKPPKQKTPIITEDEAYDAWEKLRDEGTLNNIEYDNLSIDEEKEYAESLQDILNYSNQHEDGLKRLSSLY